MVAVLLYWLWLMLVLEGAARERLLVEGKADLFANMFQWREAALAAPHSQSQTGCS